MCPSPQLATFSQLPPRHLLEITDSRMFTTPKTRALDWHSRLIGQCGMTNPRGTDSKGNELCGLPSLTSDRYTTWHLSAAISESAIPLMSPGPTYKAWCCAPSIRIRRRSSSTLVIVAVSASIILTSPDTGRNPRPMQVASNATPHGPTTLQPVCHPSTSRRSLRHWSTSSGFSWLWPVSMAT